MIYPVWPLFVTTILKANMTVLGFLDGLGDALVSISQAGSGYISDRIKKRKVFIWTGYLLGALSRLGYSISTIWPHLVPFRVLDRAGKIRSAPRDAIVADVSTKENRGKNFGFSLSSVPVLYLIFTFSAFLFSYPFGRLSDKIGRKSVLLISYLFWIAVCLIVISEPNRMMIILVFILYGAHKGALEPVQRTFVCELAPPEFRASCLGGFQMIIGLCALPASFVAGLLWDTLGILVPFYLSLILTLISGIMLLFIKKR